MDELSEEKRQIFMSLSDCKVDENEEEKTELGIWRTNNFALGKILILWPGLPKHSYEIQ